MHFVSSTIVQWIPIFTYERYFQILTESLKYSQNNKDLDIFAYVIMDNHFHLICDAPELSSVMKEFKSFTGKRIIELLEEDGKAWVLNQFSFWKKGHKSNSNYQVWQEGFHPILIQTDKMLHEKIEYIHNNPVKRGLVASPEHWKYSSASNYLSHDGELNVELIEY